MPHGENVIMVMENNSPLRMLMKDITEEIIVFKPYINEHEEVNRLYKDAPDAMKLLSIFTDVFDGFLRFLRYFQQSSLHFRDYNDLIRAHWDNPHSFIQVRKIYRLPQER